MNIKTLLVLFLLCVWIDPVPSAFAQGQVTQMPKTETQVQTDTPPPAPPIEPKAPSQDLQLRNDGSIDDLYRARQQTINAAERIKGMTDVGGFSPVSDSMEAEAESDAYVSNETCSAIARSPLYPHLCKIFKNREFSVGSRLVFKSSRHKIVLGAELLFFLFICLIRVAKRRQNVEVFGVKDFIKEVRFSLFSLIAMVILIPGAIYGSSWLAMVWGLVQIAL